MLKSRFFLVIYALFFYLGQQLSLPALAQGPADGNQAAQSRTEPLPVASPRGEQTGSERLFSPSVGQVFYEIAYEPANSEDTAGRQTEQAITFLNAALSLDSRAGYVYPLLIKLAYRSDSDHSDIVYDSLVKCLSETADLEPLRAAVQYLLDRLDSREQREQFLQETLKSLGGKNAAFDSELATLLGLLLVEKADFEAAQSQFLYAIDKNKYNQPAFAKLVEIAPTQIPPVMYLEHLRLALGENPYNLEAALALAEYTEQLQFYQTAADAYGYCAELFAYLYPSQELPAKIYLPWMISCYNTQRNQHLCLQIADRIRQTGRFDLFAEAIAGKAAAKIGDTEQAVQILKAAENNARRLIKDNPKAADYPQLAWFYCFALSDETNAIDWANKAYSMELNSPAAASLLAYALVMDGQFEWAQSFIDKYPPNQIAELALAQIQLSQGQQDAATETLKSSIARDPGSLEAERAREILTQHGKEYIPPLDADATMALLRNTLRLPLVPTFITPEKAISVQLNARGSKFSYDSTFSAAVVITNNSSEPLVISDDGLITGDIRIDANVTGDLNKKLPNLVSLKISPASPIQQGQLVLVPVQLVTAELKKLLLTYPQASVDIEFTLYLDPVVTDRGPASRLTDIKPAGLVIKRQGLGLTDKYLRNRFGSLSKGQQGQKLKTVLLFTGLLAEQNALANAEPLYQFMYADWMPAMLKSALLHCLSDDDWVVKVHTMAAMLSLPLDYELLGPLAENLNDERWPVRMMAVYILAKNQNAGFTKVLDWTAKYESNKFVQDMAVALGAAVPETAETTGQQKQVSPQQPAEPNE